MTLTLHERGLFSWSEWSTILGEEIGRAEGGGNSDTGEAYYQHWLAALERLVTAKGIVSRETLTHYREAWHHAAERTPHGAPIELRPGDF